jgi:hypothetical protein
MRHFKTIALRSTATAALLGALSFSAAAQVSVTDDTSNQILTSTAGANGAASDVTVDTSATVTVDSARSGVILDSDNALVLDGVVTSNNVNGSTGVELQGGDSRSYTQSGSITLIEDFTATDTDDDPFIDGGFAEGEGRTGILISGASPFRGNIELASGSTITIEGNDSYGINLANTPMMTEGLTGNLLTEGQISVIGDRSIGVNLASNITGNVTNNGTISARGTGAQAYAVSGDIQGGFVNSGTLNSSGFRFGQRPNFSGSDASFGRDDLTAEDLGNAGSALTISGDVSGGVLLSRRLVASIDADGAPVTDSDGNQLFTLASTSTISQFGSAPAVMIDGNGDAIAIGIVAEITDPTDAAFSETLQYGFVNQGGISAAGLYDDFDATAILFADVTIEGGINNAANGSLSSTTFRAANPTDLTDGSGISRVLVLGDQAIADRINNAGVIIATTSEAVDEVYFDRTNIVAPRALLAVAIDIESGASVTELTNSQGISAVVRGRDGTAIAIRDASGTLRTITNTGAIAAVVATSDTLGLEDTNLNAVAIDLSASTIGSTITQAQNPDTTATPLITGDIRFGAGNDSLIASAGNITGDVDFGGGADTLTLSGGTVFTGAISNTDSLALSVSGGSTLALGSADEIQVSSASFDETSVFRPVINGASGTASTLTSTGDITFDSGSTINPILNSIVGTDTFSYTLANAGNLTVGDLASLGAGESPFLYNTSLELAGDNTLVVTLDLRNPTASVENGGLGLDQVQAAAFGQVVNGEFQDGAVFQALTSSDALGNAFSNITEADDFYAAFNQILPEFSGAAHQFVLANVDGAVGAVGNHLDATRRSQDKPGGAWLQEFFYFADREKAGLSEQYRGEGFGFAGGIDTAFGPFHAVGVNASFASTEVEDVIGIDAPLDVRTYQLGGYAGYENKGFNLDVFGGVGYNEFQQSRSVVVGQFAGSANAEWDGFHANGAIRAGYTVPVSEKIWARPSLSVDYLYLNEYGHTDEGADGIRLRVDGRQTETAAATAMLDIGTKFQGKRTWIRPSVRVGYRNEFMSDPTETEFRFQGLEDASGNFFDSELARLRAFDLPDQGIILGFTVAAGSEYSSIGFDFDSDIRDGFIRHTGRVVIRLLF